MDARTLTVLLAICAPLAARGWAAPGHLVTAALAARHLPPDVREAVAQDLLASASDAGSNFTTCAVWCDTVKGSTHAFDAWHFIDLPITVAGSAPPACPGPHVNIVWALEEAAATLRSRHSDAWSRGLFLRVIVHLVGDIHQPLHTASLFSAGLPHGDEGGNSIKLQPAVRVGHTTTANELHAFWDAGCGGSGLESIRWEGDRVDMASVDALAASLDGPDVAHIASTPLADTAAVSDAFHAWADDSHAWARNASYSAELIASLGVGTSVHTDAAFWFTYAATGSGVVRHRLQLGGGHLAQVVTALYRTRAAQ